jgi:hypothetical protein
MTVVNSGSKFHFVVMSNLPASQNRIELIKTESAKDEICRNLISYCRDGWPEKSKLDENTGIQRYQTKIHEGVVPSNLTKYGKCITVNDGLTYILDKESLKQQINHVIDLNRF